MHHRELLFSELCCVVCNIQFNSFEDKKQHYFAFHSKKVITSSYASVTPQTPKIKEQTNVSKPAVVDFRCDACNVTCLSAIAYDFHTQGKKHINNINNNSGIVKSGTKINGKVSSNTKIVKVVNSVIACNNISISKPAFEIKKENVVRSNPQTNKVISESKNTSVPNASNVVNKFIKKNNVKGQTIDIHVDKTKSDHTAELISRIKQRFAAPRPTSIDTLSNVTNCVRVDIEILKKEKVIDISSEPNINFSQTQSKCLPISLNLGENVHNAVSQVKNNFLNLLPSNCELIKIEKEINLSNSDTDRRNFTSSVAAVIPSSISIPVSNTNENIPLNSTSEILAPVNNLKQNANEKISMNTTPFQSVQVKVEKNIYVSKTYTNGGKYINIAPATAVPLRVNSKANAIVENSKVNSVEQCSLEELLVSEKYCYYCDVEVSSWKIMVSHLLGKRHRHKFQFIVCKYHLTHTCTICSIGFNTLPLLNDHLISPIHECIKQTKANILKDEDLNDDNKQSEHYNKMERGLEVDSTLNATSNGVININKASVDSDSITENFKETIGSKIINDLKNSKVYPEIDAKNKVRNNSHQSSVDYNNTTTNPKLDSPHVEKNKDNNNITENFVQNLKQYVGCYDDDTSDDDSSENVGDNSGSSTNGIIVEQPLSFDACSKFSCKDCLQTFKTSELLKNHLSNSDHLMTIKLKKYGDLKSQKDPSVYCGTCDMFLYPDLMVTHRQSDKHKRKCTDILKNEPAEKKSKMSDLVTDVNYCGYCLINLGSSGNTVDHYQSDTHLNNFTRMQSSNYCNICHLKFEDGVALNAHIKGYSHYCKANNKNEWPDGNTNGTVRPDDRTACQSKFVWKKPTIYSRSQ